MKMSKSEAGKLGGKRFSEAIALAKEQKVQDYLTNPKKCRQCSSVLGYDHRYKVFCNSSCSASYNNTQRIRDKRPKYCLSCGSNIGTNGKYCSTKCQHDFQYKLRIDGWFENKTKPGFGAIRRYLTETQGYKCSACGIGGEYNNKPITLEIEHKDGNSENNTIDNLCFLCPNCHSQTPTYKSKNRGNGRHSRKQRYQEGKSY